MDLQLWQSKGRVPMLLSSHAGVGSTLDPERERGEGMSVEA